jgi:RimJ/RimL family protein N-acetyltransferase
VKLVLPVDLVIRTERLALRPLHESDAETIFALFNDWEVVRWLSTPPWPYTIEDCHDYIRRTLARADADPETSFTIAREDRAIGGIGVRIRTEGAAERRGPVIGYWLGRAHWGCGYMTEGARGLIRRVFASAPHDRIFSGAFVGNDASLRVQEKLGFVREAETMEHARPHRAALPHIHTVLTRQVFHEIDSVGIAVSNAGDVTV